MNFLGLMRKKTTRVKKEKIEDLINEFLDEFDKIDIVKAFENKNKNIGGDIMKLDELKKDHPELYEAVKKEITESAQAKEREAEFEEVKMLKNLLRLK